MRVPVTSARGDRWTGARRRRPLAFAVIGRDTACDTKPCQPQWAWTVPQLASMLLSLVGTL
jgi:hypothetical protein